MRYSANIDDQTDLNVWVLWTTQKVDISAQSVLKSYSKTIGTKSLTYH